MQPVCVAVGRVDSLHARVGPREAFLRVHRLSDVAGGRLFGAGQLAPADVECHRSGGNGCDEAESIGAGVPLPEASFAGFLRTGGFHD